MSQVCQIFCGYQLNIHKTRRNSIQICHRGRRYPKQFFAENQETEVSGQVTKEVKEEELPWIRKEKDQKLNVGGGDLPFGVYLIASALVSIAAIGSIFVFANKQDVFGVVPPTSPLYAPILGFFAFTGLPTAGFLFFKSIQGANAMAERMDEIDGV
eukprot:TRINITY_DN8395_c0_g1_i2.p2 TRINITY_DN8395_c0_g1~~TRINITY_DN8395_c0_g1_i2.p2  ORF type:complete len:156 (+),score=18.19 TRINITY_DN8395_c0_g1_i2:129-596(+)